MNGTGATAQHGMRTEFMGDVKLLGDIRRKQKLRYHRPLRAPRLLREVGTLDAHCQVAFVNERPHHAAACTPEVKHS